MPTNLDRYKGDLDKLIERGLHLQTAMRNLIAPAEFKAEIKKHLGEEKAEKLLANLPSFNETYQAWYSEAMAIIKQLLPDRTADFIVLYERPKNRRELTHSSYTVRDFIERMGRHSISLTISAGFVKFEQQLDILRACKTRFESSLFDMRQLVQADLFDSEIEAARSLLKHGFGRAAGAIAGVVLEKHLRQVSDDHKVAISKKKPTINDLNQLLKDNSITTTPQWRHITLLGDIRNLCDHHGPDPTDDQVNDLLDGTDKVLKTIF
jgi:hypothetical protein